jgi:Ca2+:H+ antiporter
MYLLYLVFALMTHSSLFAGSHAAGEGNARASAWSVRTAAFVLAATTALIAWMSEILVAAIQPTAREFGLSNAFVGVFVVAILGNAAEHATAITAALRDRMDLRFRLRSVRAFRSLFSWPRSLCSRVSSSVPPCSISRFRQALS